MFSKKKGEMVVKFDGLEALRFQYTERIVAPEKFSGF